MPTVVQTKKAMALYMPRHKLKMQAMDLRSEFWGLGARVNAWRITGSKKRASTRKADVDRILFPLPDYHVLHDYHAYHHSGNRSLHDIDFIVLHSMENSEQDMAAEQTGAYFQMKASGGSTNYGVDNNSIQQYLSDNVIPWGAPSVNTQGLHIEQMGRASWSRSNWTSKAAGTLDRTAWLIARESKKLGIPIRKLTDAQMRRGVKGVTTHAQCTRVFGGSHTDPGSGYPLESVLAKAREYRGLMP